MDSGQESAIACRKSGSKSQVNPSTRVATSAASSPAVKLTAETL